MSRNVRLALAIIYTFYLVGFSVPLVVGIAMGRSVELLVQDPAVAARGLPWFGLWSNVGALLWCAAATMCLFTAAVLHQSSGPKDQVRFIAAAGLVTLMLLIDDLFMVHEWLLPANGIPQEVAYAMYGSAITIFLVQFRQQLQGTYPLLFLSALVCFGGSILIDVFIGAANSDRGVDSQYGRSMLVLEDGLKLLGIVNWLSYFTVVSNVALLRLSAPHRFVVAEASTLPATSGARHPGGHDVRHQTK